MFAIQKEVQIFCTHVGCM